MEERHKSSKTVFGACPLRKYLFAFFEPPVSFIPSEVYIGHSIKLCTGTTMFEIALYFQDGQI